jgi:Tfp pilus assembly protein PilZ
VYAQVEPRFRKRLPCRLKVAGSSHSGMVLNLSRGGLFVQTSAGPPTGADVVVDLDVASHPDTVPIGGRVVWRRMVAPHLRTLTQGGVGVRIESAPEVYYSFLSGVSGEAPGTRSSVDCETAEPALESRSDSPGIEFRVRVKQEGGPRSRTLTLHSESEEEARSRALSIVGAGWAVLELKRSS